MLLLSDIEASVGLVQELCEQGKKLEAKPGPLALLVAELSVPVAISNSVNADSEDALKGYIPDLASMIHNASASVTRVEDTSLLDTSNHDVKLEEMCDLIAQGVMASMHQARAVIIPSIVRLEDAISAAFTTYEDRNLANVSIDEVGINQVLDNDQVYDYFAEYKSRNKITLRNTNFFPNLELKDIAKLVEAGDPEINTYLQNTLLTSNSSGELGQMVYNYLYRGDRVDESTVEPFELRNLVRDIYGEDLGIEGLMIGYYLGKGLIENIPEGTVAGLRDVEHRLKLLTSTLGLMIFSELEKYRKSVKARELLPVGLPYVDRSTGAVNAKYNIRVNKEVYAQFLADGGSPEAIYGSMVSIHVTDPAVLIERKGYLEDEYAKFVSLNRSYTTSSKLELYTSAIRDEFYRMVADTEELKGFDASNGMFLRLRDGLRRMGGAHIATPDATYDFLRSLVCHVFYPDRPELEKLISDIDNFKAQYGEEGLTTAEIANVVLVDLIVDWLCEQVSVRKAC